MTHLYLRYDPTTYSCLRRRSLLKILAIRFLVLVCNQCIFFFSKKLVSMYTGCWTSCDFYNVNLDNKEALAAPCYFYQSTILYITISSLLSYFMIGCQKQIRSVFFFYFYPLLCSFQIPTKHIQRQLSDTFVWIQKMKLNTRKRIYYIRILRHKTFFRIMVIETFVQIEQYRLRNKVAFISLHLLSRWLKWICKNACLYS